MATHAYFEKQRQNIIVVHAAKIWSDESLSLAHTHKASAQGFSVLKYKLWAVSLDLPGSPCGCSTQYFSLCFYNQTLFLKMPITCKTNDNSKEVCSNSSQRNKWSSYLFVMDSTSEAHDASTGMRGLILPNKKKTSLRHHTQWGHALCPHLDWPPFLLLLLLSSLHRYTSLYICIYTYTHTYSWANSIVPRSTKALEFHHRHS